MYSLLKTAVVGILLTQGFLKSGTVVEHDLFFINYSYSLVHIIKYYLASSTFTKLVIKTFFFSEFPQCHISSVFFLYEEIGNLELFKVYKMIKLYKHLCLLGL